MIQMSVSLQTTRNEEGGRRKYTEGGNEENRGRAAEIYREGVIRRRETWMTGMYGGGEKEKGDSDDGNIYGGVDEKIYMYERWYYTERGMKRRDQA